ncbi:MAG: MATE family efflux transporter [Clostridiales bacterium]|nr:MATE family efflux transporter [Clostridiales bacterium]
MQIQLSDHFNYSRLIRFTLPTIGMQIFSSLYYIVDGFFVSNYAGKTAFASVNFIMPFIMIMGTVGYMFGTGGSALVAKYLGQGNHEKANSLFTLFTWLALIVGTVFTTIGFIFMPQVARFLGAEGQMLDDCVLYGRVVIIGLPPYILQWLFQCFTIVAERPKLGFYFTLGAGITNMVLDWLFIGIFDWGLVGAALATNLGEVVGGFGPIIFFMSKKNTSLLRLGKTVWDGQGVVKALTNGASEMVGSISSSLVGMLYNAQLLAYAGEDGVAAYGVIMYVSYIFAGVFFGYAIGVGPVVSFNYGAETHKELQNVFKRSLKLIAVTAAVLIGLAELSAPLLASIFVGYDQALLEFTIHAFRTYVLCYIFMGFAAYASSFFTALNNGFVSALISFLRTLVFQVIAVIALPLMFGVDGIWYSVIVAEFMALVVSVVLLVWKRNQYHYW